MNAVLLASAFPDGFFARPGARTIGGWICVDEGDRKGLREADAGRAHPSPVYYRPINGWKTFHLYKENSSLIQAFRDGELLPFLNPREDPATWALVVRHLAERLIPVSASRIWQTTLHAPDNYGEPWSLSVATVIVDSSNFDLPGVLYGEPRYREDAGLDVPTTQDPVEAVCYALASLN